MDGMGVNITIMSYRGVLYWGIIASPDTIPRVWSLAAGIPRALDELLAAAGAAPSTFHQPGPRRRPGRRGSGTGGGAVDQDPALTRRRRGDRHRRGAVAHRNRLPERLGGRVVGEDGSNPSTR